MLVRKQRRLNGKKQNYWLDTDTGTEYSSKPHDKRKGRREPSNCRKRGPGLRAPGDELLSVAEYRKVQAKRYAKRVSSLCNRERKRRLVKWFGEWDCFVIDEANALIATRYEETGFKWEVDHMLPLRAETVSGLHCGDNLQILPRLLNRRKRNRLMYTEPGEWLRELKA